VNFTDQRKGQSAIEFLMDYGWMLLVVAVIGAALFTYIQGMGDIQSVSGLNNRDIQVEDFSVNEQGLKAELRSVSADEINNLSLSLIDEDTGEIVYSDEVVGIAPAGTNITEISAAELSDNTRTYRVRATYDVGELENISSEGSITGRIAFNKTVEKKKEEEPVKTNIKASFDMNDSSPFDLGTTVKFNASESSPSSDIEAYEWDFDGDGAVDRVGKTVNYEFSEIGERQINLTVEASSGGYARESKTVEVVSGDETVVSDSLQERIDAADPGDTLYVENGTYTGINVPKELSIYGEEGATIAGRSYIQAANVSIRGFRINDRLDVDADSFDLKDSSIDSRDASNWGIVVDRDDLELKNVDIKAAKGAIALQNNIKGADLDLVDAETESSGRPALRLQNNVEASVEGGSFESNGGRALYTDGGNSDLTLSSNPSFKTSGWAFSIDRSTDLDVNGTLDVEEGKGSVNMMSIAAESGDKIRLEEGKVVNGAQEVAVNVPEPDLRDRYGYPIENPTKKYYPTNLAADNSVLTVKEGEKVELRYARVYGENMTLRDLEVRPTSGNYGIETMADNITLKNITVDQPRTWAIVNRNDGLLIEDSKISGQRGVHTDGVSGVTIKDSIIDSGRHGIRPKGGAKDILLEGNRFSVDNNVVNGDGNGIEVRMEDNIVERSNNVVSASDSSFEIINNTLNAQYSALPSGSGLDITLGTENIVEKGEFLSGVVSQADVGGSVDVTGEKVEILGKDVLVDISDIDHAKGTAHLRTKDVSISLTDKAPEFDVLRFHKDDISVEGMDIDTTRGKYAIETYSDGVVLEDIDLHNPNDYGIVNRGNNITLRDSRIDSRKEFYTDGGTSGHVIRNNTLISTNSLGFRPNGQITGFKIIDNYFKSNQNGISLKSGSEGEIRDNIFNVGSTAVSIPDNNDVDLGVNTIEKGIGTTVTSLDSVSERGEQIKITNTSAFVAGSNHRFEFVGGAAQESLGAIDLKTEGLLLNFTEPVEVSTGDRAIDVLGDNITVRNAYLTGSHGIEFHGNDGKITGSTMDVNNWGVLTRNDNNVVRGSHIVAEDGVHTNNNLNDIVVEDNVIQARQYGIRAKSGTTGEALNNRIDAGTPLQTADMDTSGN